MEETQPSTGFDPEDKPKNLKVIKGHFDKLELYSFYDITILQEENELDIENISYGIVAGFAVWSGYSFSNSAFIMNQIKDNKSPKIKLIIIDTDYFNIDIQKKLFGTAMHGYFECCLVKEGTIIARHKSKPEVQPFIDSVKRSRASLKTDNEWILLDDWKESGGVTTELLIKWATTENSYFKDQDEDLLLYKPELIEPMIDLLFNSECVRKVDLLKILKNYSEYVFIKKFDQNAQNEFNRFESIDTDNKVQLELIEHLKEIKSR